MAQSPKPRLRANSRSVLNATAALANRWLVLAVTCAVIVSLGLVFVTVYGHGIAIDFKVFWTAARSKRPYAPDNFAPFAYPPPALIWIKPLAFISFWPAFVLWSLVSVGCYLGATRRGVLLLSPAVAQCLAYGQATLLIAALLLAPTRSWHKGAAIGVAMTLKPQLLFVAPLVFVARRDWLGISAIIVGATISIVASVLLFGIQPWLDWVGALSHFGKVVADRQLWWVTITPYGTAMWLGLPPWPFWFLGAALALFVALRSRADPVFVSILASLLASPYAVAHDLVALLPFCFAHLEKRQDALGKPWAALLYAAAFVPLALAGMAIASLRGKLSPQAEDRRRPAWIIG